jgi:hypothetical protein
MKQIKLIAILGLLLLVGIVLNSSHQFSSEAKGDNALEEIAKYKTWARISKADEKVELGTFKIYDSSVAG